ncbi:aldehyde ferredoxin oxidoreductase N-terminal domain-containing protein [Desulfobacterium sp. N47]|uniref:Aldehyde ferredoxin oxidoreductase N-terminal domain-containing protein n=1 Tax=uncultured Desulfobacterium sp. TaxID=201089 RepID=E1YMH9_9BACT|nr:hypothetical protein N47_N25980 [uncultured Desulfobacterium sp.]
MSEQYGWAGQILRVNLTTGEFSTVDTMKYVPKYIGGYGIALRLCWEEMKPGIKAFDPESKVFIMNGVASGTMSPCSGRVNFLGMLPQSYPEQFTNTSIGGHFPARLKWNGYDGIILEGKSEKPCYLVIKNGKPSLEPAKGLWGLGLIDSQQILQDRYGKNRCDIYGIGPAGENLIRYAIVGCGAHNATGQGGMGAVLGSKKLKAIVLVGGKHQVKVKDPEAAIKATMEFYPKRRKRPLIYGNLGNKSENPWWEEWTGGKDIFDNHAKDWMGSIHNMPYPIFAKSCAAGCLGGCGFFEFKNVPAVTRPGLITGMSGCVHTRYEQFFDRLEGEKNFEKGFEVHVLAQQLGFNHHEINYGIVPWLHYTKQLGIDTESLMGMPTDVRDHEWWIKLLNMIAYRKGFGDTLAEGLRRTVEKLGPEKYWYPEYEGLEAAREGDAPRPVKYPVAGIGGWGYTSRGILADHAFGPIAALPGALCWMIDTRDPHHNKWPDWIHNDFISYIMKEPDKYGSPFVVKWAKDATMRGILIDCLPVCFQFPLRKYMGWLYEHEEIGEGTKSTGLEARLFSAVTGIEMSEAEYYKAGERINTLTRAILCRDNERTAKMEWDEIEKVMYKRIDMEKFKVTVANWYEALGWNRETGYPTMEHLKDMGLEYLAPELEKIGKLG